MMADSMSVEQRFVLPFERVIEITGVPLQMLVFFLNAFLQLIGEQNE